MLVAVLSSFLMSLVFGLISTKKGTSWTALYAVFPLALFLFFLNQFIALDVTGARWFQFDWVPSLGVDFSFYLDGLSLLFLLLITGIGTLVFAYTAKYMHGDQKLSRFFAYLTLFMGAMIGLVSSDNLITLFVFWELTSYFFFLVDWLQKQRSRVAKIRTNCFSSNRSGRFVFTRFCCVCRCAVWHLLHSRNIKQLWKFWFLANCNFDAAFAYYGFHKIGAIPLPLFGCRAP